MNSDDEELGLGLGDKQGNNNQFSLPNDQQQ